MSPADALAAWSRACDGAGVAWYLYRENLLCANGYRCFPQQLQYAQVVIFANDLPSFAESVLPQLPDDWKLSMLDLAAGQAPFSFEKDGETVLQVDILWPVESDGHAAALTKQLKQIRAKTAKRLRLRNVLQKLLGWNNERFFAPWITKAADRAVDEIFVLARQVDGTLPFYSDLLTGTENLLLDREHFANTEMLACKEGTLSVFAGYREYLQQVYGDYEQGLTDSIGVGLTAADKEALRAHQTRCKEALAFLQELSREFGLRYYLLAGSVLGPVRHGGFIPWDDDVDVGIRIEDLETFEAVVREQLPKRLPEGFTLMQSGANDPYPRMFSKICYDGRCCIDLWPLVPTYLNGLKAKLTWYFAKIITKAHYYHIGHEVTQFIKIVKAMCWVWNDKQIMAMARYNERKYAGKNTPAYINLYSIYRRDKETIRREWLDTPATQSFDGLQVPVVGCTEQYLQHLYGDYMAQPAPWKRASRHVERFYPR